jgi:branched-chain amino acid transport system permease protein
MADFLQAIFSGLTIGSVYALIGVGFVFVFSSTRVVNFAQGDWAMAAGMAAATISGALTASRLALPAAAVLAIAVGGGLGFAAFRFFLGWSRSFDVVTVSLILLGMSLILQGVAVWIWGTDPLGIPSLATLPPVRFGGAVITQLSLMITLITFGLLVLVALFFEFTRSGQSMIAVAANAEAAALCGINVRRVILVSYVLSGVLAGLGGFLVTPVTSMNYLGGLPLTLKAFAAAAVGGLRRPTGAVIGGFALGLLEALAATYVHGGGIGPVASLGAALLLLLIVAPRWEKTQGRAEEAQGAIEVNVTTDVVKL